MTSLAGVSDRSLTWLHISDLHFEPTSTFDRRAVLAGLVKHTREERDEGRWVPDFIFVTGDIANRGADEEYKQASTFFDDLLAATGCDRSRLFVVPGNHDVDRSQCVLLQRTLTDESASDEFFDEPDDPKRVAAHRALTDERHLAKLRAFRNWHAEYFKDVHALDRVSASAPPCVVDVRGIRVGVLPINTATFAADESDHNKLWVGRTWLERAIKRIEGEKTDLRVALMHHPLDWLHDVERTQIKVALSKCADVVLRGHLHDTEAEATASARASVVHLAAGATYQHPLWPRRALYARADLARRVVRIRPIRYEKDPHREWTVDASLYLPKDNYEAELPLPNRSATASSRTSSTPADQVPSQPPTRVASGRIGTHTRTWSVYPDGIAEVCVEMTDVRCDGALVLAMPEAPFCAISHDPTVTPNHLAVERVDIAEGRPRFSLIAEGPHTFCTWRYKISNALPLDRSDAKWLQASLPTGLAGRPHVVGAECDRLRLVYEFDSPDEVIDDALAIVESRREEHGRDGWERNTAEAQRCKISIASSRREVSLEVEKPLVHHRYTLAYRPRRAGRPLTTDAEARADELLAACRGRDDGHGGLVGEMRTAIEEAFRPLIGGSLGHAAAWLGLIWDTRKRRLMTCFGRFANRAWSVRFSYGGGVPGHALRFAKTATWVRDSDPRHSVIYQEKTDAGGDYSDDYRWVVCVPLLVDLADPAIGIISFASSGDETAGDRWLQTLAREAHSQDPTAAARAAVGSARLLEANNLAFWGQLRVSEHSSDALKQFADDVVRRFEHTTP